MKDYSVEIKVKNNYLLTAMKERGYETAAQLSRASGVAQTEIGKMLNLKVAPINKVGRVVVSVQRLADFLMVDIEDMFPPQNILNPLEVNKTKIELNMSEMMSSNLLENKAQDQLLIAEEAKMQIYDALDEIRPLRSKVVKMHLGLGHYDREHTFEEIGQEIGRSRERVRQIYNQGLRNLRNPTRSQQLRTYLEDEI